MIYIKLCKDGYRGIPSNGKLFWIVENTKYKSVDICWSFSDAIRFYLWNLGIPAKYVFRKHCKKKSL